MQTESSSTAKEFRLNCNQKVHNQRKNLPSLPLILSQWLSRNIRLYQTVQLPIEDFIVNLPSFFNFHAPRDSSNKTSISRHSISLGYRFLIGLARPADAKISF
jgi:hypothetical protein